MCFEEFKATLIMKHGRVVFNEVGKYGWTSIEDILDRRPNGNSGPHWCDASPVPRTQRLLGKYDFNMEIATFF
jgi:hypothetical protein